MVNNRLNNCIPGAAIFLLHMLLYSGMASFTLRRDQVNRLGTTMLPFLFAIAVAAWVVPWAVHCFLMARVDASPRAGRWQMLPALAILAALPLCLMAGFGPWLHNIPLRHISNASMAILLPTTYTVFYSLVTPRQRGLWFGAGLAAGFVLWRALVVAAAWWESEANASGDSGLYAVYLMQIALSILLAAFLLYGLFSIPVEPPMENRYFASDIWRLPVRRRAIWLLFGASGLVYVMNAFIDIRMFPVLLDRTASPFEPLQLIAALSCPLIGWLLDRNPAANFRRIALGCACVFILAPTLAALGETPGLYRLVHAATAAGQFAILVTFSTVLAGLAPSGDGIGKYAGLLFAWRGVSILGFLLVQVTMALPTGAAALLATIMATGYYLLIRQIDLSGKQSDESEKKAQRDGNTPQPDPETLFMKYGLSPREREVALLWIKGAGTREMATTLFISENTVKAHIKSILAKLGAPNRTAFLVQILDQAGHASAPE